LVCSLTLFLFGSIMPSCKPAEIENPSYQVKRNCYYQDLIWEFSSSGKIEISHIASDKEGENSGEKKQVVLSKDIRPVDMKGAEKFMAKNFDLLMQSPGNILQELYLPGGINRILVQVRGTNFEGEAARMRVRVDDIELGEVDILSELDSYVFPMQLEKGKHRIDISFLNGEQHRKLIITNVPVDRAIFDYSESIQTYIARRLLDDTLNGLKGVPFVIMGKMNNVSRRSLFLPSPSQAEIMLTVPVNATLQFAAGIDEFVWGDKSSECEFQVIFEESKEDHILYREKFQPNKYERQKQWLDVNIDLSEF